jgi:hypothetical protein
VPELGSDLAFQQVGQFRLFSHVFSRVLGYEWPRLQIMNEVYRYNYTVSYMYVAHIQDNKSNGIEYHFNPSLTAKL